MIKFLEVKRAYYADPENVVVQFLEGKFWGTVLKGLEPKWDAQDYRVRPRTIRIGDIDVPEPVRDIRAMHLGNEYWVFDQLEDDFVTDYEWENDKYDIAMLNAGLIHLTKEAAIAHAKALILVSGGKIDD